MKPIIGTTAGLDWNVQRGERKGTLLVGVVGIPPTILVVDNHNVEAEIARIEALHAASKASPTLGKTASMPFSCFHPMMGLCGGFDPSAVYAIPYPRRSFMGRAQSWSGNAPRPRRRRPTEDGSAAPLRHR